MITPEDIYNRTNGGLDIILSYYPQAKACLSDNKHKFKMRDEKTPSACLRKFGEIWKVTDFGDDGRAIGPIDICMRESGLTFTEAIFRLADRYGIENQLSKEINKPDIQKRPATAEEEEGATSFDLNESFTESELKILVPKATPEELKRTADACKKYNWFSVKSYSRTKNRETTIIESNENYPIFLRDCGDFKKIYQPLNPDKGFRFFYTGKKPAEYINGLSELEKVYTSLNNTLSREWEADQKNENKPYVYTKIPEVFICSGERDALCVAAFNYYPIWFNSETYRLSEKEYKQISKYADIVYNIPDLDETGIKKGIELGMTYLDIHTVWLPDWLKTYKDMRGRPRKDLRDFVELRPVKKYFKELVTVAMPLRFWELTTDDKGRKRYDINTEYVYHFLKCNGFATIEDKNSKTGKMFIQIEKNIVKEVFVKDIRNFLRNFMKSRYMEIQLRNMVNNSKRLTDSVLDAIDEVSLDFSDFTKNSQLFFFPNITWSITSKGVEELAPSKVKNYVWDEEVIPHNVKRIDPAFSINCEPSTDFYELNVNHIQSNFFKYLINTCRVHWRKELETEVDKLTTYEEQEKYREINKFEVSGILLSDEEKTEQKWHLINKIFCIGYLLHRYKSDSRAWCVFAMDNKVGNMDDSNGRSGKSFCFKTLRLFMKAVTLSGRNKRLTENPHIYDRVTEYTDMVLVDDGNAYLDFDFFFDVVTGDMTVNPKNNKSYEIPFDKAPKFCITSNYTLRKVDPSTEGRILYAVFSDYYHQKTADNDYRETRSIFDDFGKNLLRDYSEEEWNADINFLADCCQFYLSMINRQVKIQPPMDNVITRNLITQMGGDVFMNWAEIYFNAESENIDKLLPKEDAFKDFVESSRTKNWTMQTFTKSLRAYCKFAPHIIELDPVEFKNSQGRIIKKVDGKSTEMIYVRTKENMDVRDMESISENEENLPF